MKTWVIILAAFWVGVVWSILSDEYNRPMVFPIIITALTILTLAYRGLM